MKTKKDKLVIAVGSTNQAKIEPVKIVFAKHFPDIDVVGVKAASGVADQPMSDEETFQGAFNRASSALEQVDGAEYGVGIEGGLNKFSYGWFERNLVVIVNRKGEMGIGSTGGIVLPSSVVEQIHQGKTLGEAVDSLFSTTNIGQGIGLFGMLTDGVVTRSSGLEHGIAFALARFMHSEIY